VILSALAAYLGRASRNPVARKENGASSPLIAFMTDSYAIIIGAVSTGIGENVLVLGQIMGHPLCLHELSFHIEHYSLCVNFFYDYCISWEIKWYK